jgi:hypothetical protein
MFCRAAIYIRTSSETQGENPARLNKKQIVGVLPTKRIAVVHITAPQKNRSGFVPGQRYATDTITEAGNGLAGWVV